MRFKEFLMIEDGVGARHIRPAKMTLDEMVEWVQNNAMGFVSRNIPIYRGVDSKDNVEGLYNGAQLNRKAANTNNYLNLWMSNHNDWSAYPARTKSFICSTDEAYAEDYGTAYMMIPSDSSSIGVCPSHDLWYSFPNINKIVSHSDMDKFMKLTRFLTSFVSSEESAEHDWDTFAYVLNKLDIEELKKIAKYKTEFTPEYVNLVIEYMEKNQCDTVFEMWENIFSPKKFKLEKASSFDAPSNHEVWLSGSVLMVHPETWHQIKEQL